MLPAFGVVLVGSLLLTAVSAAVSWQAQPFNPAAVPLAVRSPYLSAWLLQGNVNGTALNEDWPRFWTGSILGWAGYINVDGQSYYFLGTPNPFGAQKAVQKSFKFTATQSSFVMTAGPVDLSVTFLSPVEPGDLTKQSFPFSYLVLSAVSTDIRPHSIQVYTDISAEWITGNNSLNATWSTNVGDIITHQVQLQDQVTFSEVDDHTQYGSAYYSTRAFTNTTYQSGEDAVVRQQFVTNGKLTDSQDTNFRRVSDRWPVFGFAHDLGNVTVSQPVIISIGHVRDPAIQYIVANDVLQPRSLYFLSQFANIGSAISTFHNDYNNALTRANAFDTKVNSDASKISSDYASIVSLSIRQSLAATEITVAKNEDNSLNATDILMFMKEISSDGNVNTVDVIFPAWPLFLYANPTLGKYLLLPLFEYQATGQYPNNFSVHDMGSSYPIANGHNNGADEHMPVEESGNMLIMALSYTQRSGDRSLITKYFDLLDQWTQFLITDSLIPANQISTDDFAGPLANQTNLAIKGIIGIKAMSVIATLLGDTARATNYSSIASSYVSQWQKFATSSDGKHLTLSYGNNTSWGLSYNLYADRLLGTNIFPTSVYSMQTSWYSTVAGNFGVPLDTRHSYTKSDWQIWTAGLVTDTSVRDLLVGSVRKYAANGLNNEPFSDWYDTITGRVQGFRARPVVGGHLALLALQPTPPSTANNNNNNPSASPSPSASEGRSLITDHRTLLFAIVAPLLLCILLI